MEFRFRNRNISKSSNNFIIISINKLLNKTIGQSQPVNKTNENLSLILSIHVKMSILHQHRTFISKLRFNLKTELEFEE